MDNKNERKFSYYSRIVMMIILSMEFLLNIIFLAVINGIKDKYYEKLSSSSWINAFCKIYDCDYDKKEIDIFNYHYKGISATFSLFFISFFVFLIQFIAYCSCQKANCNEFVDMLFKEFNHVSSLITFFICQFLYFIECLIIPVYYQRIKNLHSEKFPLKKNVFQDTKEKYEKKYISLIVVSFLFLFIILFLDFIVINLYKGICCRMEEICKHTENCCENFGRWFADKLSCLCCKEGPYPGPGSGIHENDRKIIELTGEIRDLMAQNIEINTKNILS